MTSWPEFIMRIGLGIVFLNSGVGKLFLNVRPPVDKIITFLPADTSLLLLGLIELVIGILFVLGLFTKFTGRVSALFLLIIILSGLYLNMYSVILKDIVLLAAAWHLSKIKTTKYALDSFFGK